MREKSINNIAPEGSARAAQAQRCPPSVFPPVASYPSGVRRAPAHLDGHQLVDDEVGELGNLSVNGRQAALALLLQRRGGGLELLVQLRLGLRDLDVGLAVSRGLGLGDDGAGLVAGSGDDGVSLLLRGAAGDGSAQPNALENKGLRRRRRRKRARRADSRLAQGAGAT
jgi:hypothetical protein